MRDGRRATVGICGLDDTLETIRDEMRKFADDRVVPHAHGWHRRNSYIPLDVIAQMSELGVFSLTIPRNTAAWGLARNRMCVVSEELSRGYIGVGSLGTRSKSPPSSILGRDRRAEAQGCRNRVRRSAADGGLYRAQYRL